jgi:alanyl-tRNA synthetase
MIRSSQIRQSFLEFFERRGHRIVPSAPVIPHGDPTLLFTNAGMNQFKDVFLGTGKREYNRAVDTQKCIRVSGKHNDLEEVGRDTYHHTFFEMLGNWSFGDYYKKEAIEWAWELLTKEWGLEKKRLYATVFETDDEAFGLWQKVTDIDPSHVLRFGKKDNFWEMGETGPCGPCSEIHIDLTPDLSGGELVNAGDARVMEIWNLVFIQNNRKEGGELEDLPAKHVDTGMGFERMCAVLQRKNSNYDTDVFMPIITAIAQRVGREYTGRLESPADIAMRVIADHIRMLTFAIADGAIPSNEGRGYVLRRILRRAARFGRNLDMKEPFVYTITGAVVESMGSVFPEIVEKKAHIEKVIKAEEEGFNITLDRGLEIFESVVERIGHSKAFPGEDAFKLYDTYGFPLDLTQLMAEERGLKVDVGGFTELMEEQKSRSRESSNVPSVDYKLIDLGAGVEVSPLFVGYDHLEYETTLIAGEGKDYAVLEATPFYAESGGQVGDTGDLLLKGSTLRVKDTRKSGLAIVHLLDGQFKGSLGERVVAKVDTQRRMHIQRNHSATHIVHEALRRVLGTHVHQQGSLVAPDHLRFDFPHFGKITPEEIRAIEEIVNGKIADDISVFTEVDIPIEKARKIPNVKMFFGDKYGDTVRVVFIDETFSVEFCGGTHVKNTKDIGVFKIISESSIASGVRRIEAVTGEGVGKFIEQQLAKIQHVDDQLARLIEETENLERELNKYAVKTPKTTRPALGAVVLPHDQAEAIRLLENTLAQREKTMEQASKQAQDLKKELSKHKVKEASQGIEGLVDGAVALNGFKVVSSQVDASTMDELKSMGDTLRAKLGSGVGVLASVIDEKVALVCVVTDDLIKAKNLNAGKIVGEMAKQVGGGGGGRPHMATAGGKDVAKLDSALRQAPAVVQAMLSQ